MQVAEPIRPSSVGALVVNEMRLMYGSKFAQQWQGVTPRELKDSWDQKLSGMSESEVRIGLLACMSREWPPSVPEFVRLCQPWTNPELAYQDAVAGMTARRRGEMGKWPHPAVYWAAVAVGAHDLLQCTYGVLKARWERVFTEELAKSAWPEIPPVREVLPAPGKTQLSREDIAPQVQKLVANALRPKADQREWAKKVVTEHERKGGRKASLTVLAMAKRALGIELNPGEEP